MKGVIIYVDTKSDERWMTTMTILHGTSSKPCRFVWFDFFFYFGQIEEVFHNMGIGVKISTSRVLSAFTPAAGIDGVQLYKYNDQVKPR